ALGLEKDGFGLGADARELRLHHEAMRLVAHEKRLADRGESPAAPGGFLQQRALAVQRVQRLGVMLARKRPQAGTRSAAQDDGLDHGRRDAELNQRGSPREKRN